MRASPNELVVGYSVCCDGIEECVASIVEWVLHGDGVRWLACLNPHSYATALRESSFDAALRDADWLIPDGIGVVFASRLARGGIRERVTGSDVFFGVNGALNQRGGARMFFIGSTEDTLARIRERMAQEYPHVHVVGTYSPPFKSTYSNEEVDAMVAAVNEAKPDVVWVGMTAPKQETWIYVVRGRLNAKFVAGIGAVFDFYVGRVRRSPAVFQRLGLEWLPRLIQEPRRLWRRMLISAPVFVAHVIRDRIRAATSRATRA